MLHGNREERKAYTWFGVQQTLVDLGDSLLEVSLAVKDLKKACSFLRRSGVDCELDVVGFLTWHVKSLGAYSETFFWFWIEVKGVLE